MIGLAPAGKERVCIEIIDSESDFPVHQTMSYARELPSEAKNRPAWQPVESVPAAKYKLAAIAYCANALAESSCSRSNSKLLAR